MFVAHFFQAGKPYHNTDGYQHNHHWMHGVAGSMQECLRLSANMGGNILTMKYPGLETLEDVLKALAPYTDEDFTPLERESKTLPETVPPLPEGTDLQSAIAEELSGEEGVQLSADALIGMNLESFMKLNNKGVRQISESLDIVLPSHSEQFSQLGEAKMNNTFNYVQYIGDSRTQIDVLKAFVLMRVGEMLVPEETE